MPFPWKEYIWVVVLLSLAIGLAVELQRGRQLNAFREQAVREEARARELATQIAEATDTRAQFGSNPQFPGYFNPSYFVGFEEVYFVANDNSQRTVHLVHVRNVWRTDERHVFPSLTGMMDLDILLVIVPVTALSIWLMFLLNSKLPARKPDWKNEFSLQMFRLWGAPHILFMTAFCIFAYQGLSFGSEYDCKPFFGAFMLTTLAIFVPRYFYLCSLTTDEHARLIEETQGKLVQWEKVREWCRFQLRDLFWLMLAISLASAIFVEHRRGRELMPYRGLAQWWSNATQALEKKQEELRAKGHTMSQRATTDLVSAEP